MDQFSAVKILPQIHEAINLINSSKPEITALKVPELEFSSLLFNNVNDTLNYDQRMEDPNSMSYLLLCDGRISSSWTHKTTADGNCLYSAASIILTGDERLTHLLRALVSIELITHADYYANHPHIRELVDSGKEISLRSALRSTLDVDCMEYVTNDNPLTVSIIEQAKRLILNGRWSPRIAIYALASVIKKPICSMYPPLSNFADRHNFTVHPRECAEETNSLSILWANTQSAPTSTINNMHWSPNHFVPVIRVMDGSEPPKKRIKDSISIPSSHTTGSSSMVLSPILRPISSGIIDFSLAYN